MRTFSLVVLVLTTVCNIAHDWIQSPLLNTSFGTPGRAFLAPKLRTDMRKAIAQTVQMYA